MLIPNFFSAINSMKTGFELGGSILLLNTVMDNTVSYNSTMTLLKESPKLYVDGLQKNYINLLLISPLNYIFADKLVIDHLTNNLDLIKLGILLLIHNIMFYLSHKTMHLIPSLRKYHNYHHKFIKPVPSSGIAVTLVEYQFGYVLPFLVAGLLTNPNNLTFQTSIWIISILTSFIHCKEMRHLKWPSFLVSPDQHIVHHETYSNTYSAPLINFDKIDMITFKNNIKDKDE